MVKPRIRKMIGLCALVSLFFNSSFNTEFVVKANAPDSLGTAKLSEDLGFQRDTSCRADSEMVDEFEGKSNVLHIKRNPGEPDAEGKYTINNSKIAFYKEYDKKQEGAIVSFSLYDDCSDHSQVVIHLENSDAQKGECVNLFFGIKCNYSRANKAYSEGYWYRAQMKDGDDIAGFIDIPRTTGWHDFVIDMSNKGEVVYTLDKFNTKKVTVNPSECLSFSKLCIGDYWWDANGEAGCLNPDIYLAGLKVNEAIDEVVDCPTEPKTYDLLNKFGWKAIEGYENYTNYEYSLDGGQSYKDCSDNPQQIPEGEYAVGMVCVRRKQIAMDQPFFPALSNDVAFTTNTDDIFLDFESQEDFDRVKVYEGNKALVDEESHSGNHSVKLIGKTDFNRNLYLNLDGKTYSNKVISIWFYDDMNPARKIMFGPGHDLSNMSRPWETTNEKWHFLVSDMKYYSTRINKELPVSTSVPCSKGWHNFLWDFTDSNNCKMSIDGVLVRTATVEEPVVTSFAFLDFWNVAGMTKDASLIFDDFSISSDVFTLNLIEAPSNPIENDQDNTFGFTYVPGYEEATLYEYSCDGGSQWSTCSQNPVMIPDGNFAAGEVQVRLRAINGLLPGLKLRSESPYTSTLADELKQLSAMISNAEAFYPGDYKHDQKYEIFVQCLNDAKSITEESSSEEIAVAKNNLEEAISNLTQVVPNYVVYEFEQGEAELNPFKAKVGALTKGECLSVFGKDPRMHYNDKHGAELLPVSEDGKYVSEANYSFANSISDYVVKIGYNTIANIKNKQEIVFCDEFGKYLGFRSLAGNQTNFQVFYNNGDGEVTVDTGIRRLNNDRTLTWDFVNTEGKAVLYMDDLNLASADMTSFNQIIIRAYDGMSADETVKFDRLVFMKENHVTGISTSKDSVVLGYYETFDMAKSYLTLEKEDMSYDTTDQFTYESNNKEIANITSEGSVEPMSPGKTIVTVSTNNGCTKSVDIEVKDFKIESIYLTDSPLIDIKAMGAPGQDNNNSKPVKKLLELTLDVNDSKVINVVLDPANATARLVDWSSDNEDIVHVRDGLVTGINYGTATITVKTKDGSNLQDSIKVTVKRPDYARYTKFYVSINGDDYTGDGSEKAPFKTIVRARDEVRSLCGNYSGKGVVIFFEKGNYSISDTITFDGQDAGTEQTPIVYSAVPESDVKFVGGVSFGTNEFKKVDITSPIYHRIPESAREKVYSVDLSQWGIEPKDLQVVGHSAGGLKHFRDVFSDFNFDSPYYSICLNGDPMTLSRYPNSGYIKVSKIVNQGEYSRHWMPDMILSGNGYEYQSGMEKDTFSFTSAQIPQEKLDRWKESVYEGNRGIWMIGYWGAAFSDQSVPVKEIEGSVIKSGLISHYNPSSRSDFYVYNLIEELDSETEWYIDENTDPKHPILYFYPPAGVDMEDSNNCITIPTLDTEMFCFDNTGFITLTDIDMEGANKGIATIKGGSSNIIRNADIRNTMGAVGRIENGNEIARDNGFSNCTFSHIDGGIGLSGGDLNSLERGYNFVENCTFTDISRNNKTYNPAVGLYGVGNRVTNTVISNSPHNVIMFSGPESTIEFCELYDCVKTAGDQAGIYTGRDTIDRGTIIRNSYFHNIYHSDKVENSGIYLDDAKAGVDILDCVFDNTAQGITLGGGRDVNIIGCKFINLSVGITTSPGGYISMSGQYQHGLGTICNSSNYDNMTTVPWNDKESSYGRFNHLSEVMDDNMKAGKYCKVIDCEFINMKKFRPDANETIKDYNIWSKFWKVMSYEQQKEIIDDWIFTKNNKYSNNEGTDDISYKATYNITLLTEGKGSVMGSRENITKGLEYKVAAKPASGFKFVAWKDQSGKTVSTNAVYVFTVESDKDLTAVFEAIQ